MMKQRMTMILVLFVLISALTGCGTKMPNKTTAPTVTTAPNSKPTHLEEPESIAPTAPINPENPIDEYEPNRDIYIMCGQHNYTIYGSYSCVPGFYFYIFSKTPLDTEQVDLSLPIQSPYTVKIREHKLEGIKKDLFRAEDPPGSYTPTQFPYYLYQIYRGKDFAEIARQRDAYRTATEDLKNGKISYDEYEQIQKEYESNRDAELEDYSQLSQQAMLPEFYVYLLGALFDTANMVEESFTTADVIIGDEVYHVNTGEMHLRKDLDFPAELDWFKGASVACDGILGNGNAPLPFNNELHKVLSYFSFSAKESLTITDLVLDNPNQELVNVWVRITTADGFYSEIEWDRTEPIEIYEGDRVQIDIAYREKNMDRIAYTTKVWGFLIYDYEGGTACKLSECQVDPSWNYYEVYAMVFDGLDLESYYTDYYYPMFETWR